jgi:amino-acid N-acetyltransferase
LKIDLQIQEIGAKLKNVVRKPKLTEVVEMKALLDSAAATGAVLPRELPELYENVRDFYVYVTDSGIGGLVALHVDMVDLAEVRSLVVREDLRGEGIGEELLEAVLNEARGLDIARVYAFTRVPVFFEKNKFRMVDKEQLPYKVFKDCSRCRLFPGCDEIAMVRDLKGEAPNNEE